MNNIICFTKIGIVQLKINGEIRDELTTSDFVQRITNAIENDVSKHQVEYDKKSGTYIIFHNGKKYTIYYGDTALTKNSTEIDTIQIINDLINLTSEQRKKQEFSGPVKENESRSMNQIIYDGNNDIFVTEDDKLKYIEYLKGDLKKSIIFDIEKTFDELTEEYCCDSPVLLIPHVILVVVGIVLTIVLQNAWYLAMTFGAVCDGVFAIETEGYSLVGTILEFIFRVIKTMIASPIIRALSKRQKKKRIKQLTDSIVESELSENMSEITPVKVNQNTSSNKLTLKGETKETIERVLAKLSQIDDKDIRRRYGERLKEIMEACRNISPQEYNKRYSNVLYQLSVLDGDVSKDFINQLSTHLMASEFEKTQDIVDSISTQIGRKKR